MIAPASTLLETVSRVTPMGVRFRDIATGAIVADGLEVRVRPADAPRRWQPAFATRGGTFAAADLPGLRELKRDADGMPRGRDLERGAGDAAYWAAIGAGRRPFVVEVTDRWRRYLPMTIALSLPHRGLALPACVAPKAHGEAVPLYPAPALTPAPGLAAVRVELWDAARDAPASWARVEVTLGGEVATGVADDRGAVLVLAPWPRIANGASQALAATTWPVRLHAFFGAQPREEIPDLCDVLSQPERTLSLRPDTDAALGGDIRLRLGHELVLAGEAGRVFVRSSA
jgi:hypothetical protein